MFTFQVFHFDKERHVQLRKEMFEEKPFETLTTLVKGLLFPELKNERITFTCRLNYNTETHMVKSNETFVKAMANADPENQVVLNVCLDSYKTSLDLDEFPMAEDDSTVISQLENIEASFLNESFKSEIPYGSDDKEEESETGSLSVCTQLSSSSEDTNSLESCGTGRTLQSGLFHELVNPLFPTIMYSHAFYHMAMPPPPTFPPEGPPISPELPMNYGIPLSEVQTLFPIPAHRRAELTKEQLHELRSKASAVVIKSACLQARARMFGASPSPPSSPPPTPPRPRTYAEAYKEARAAMFAPRPLGAGKPEPFVAPKDLVEHPNRHYKPGRGRRAADSQLPEIEQQ